MNNLSKQPLHGNHLAWQQLVQDCETNHMAHAYLFTGLKGLGKASMAIEYIKYILQANDVLAKRIDNYTFLDLLYIDKQDKNEITIDSIRKSNDFFNQTSAESKYKFIIIDAVDDLNLNAANALLKVIEEPRPNTFLFLINHVPSKILSTIRSRCRVIKFFPLNTKAIQELMGVDNFINLEDLVAGSPGKAKLWNEKNIFSIYKQLLEVIYNNNILEFNKFADYINTNLDLWEIVKELLLYIINRCIKISNKHIQIEHLTGVEIEVLPNISTNKTTEEWFKIYDELLAIFQKVDIYNLDKKQILFTSINSIYSK